MMGFSWSYKSLPEFRNVAPELRDDVWKRCVRRSSAKRWEWVVVFAVIAGIYHLARHLPQWLGLAEDDWLGFACMVIAGFIPVWIWGHVVQYRARQFIAEEMPGHCQGCGYNLCGIRAEKCPECGTSIDSPA